jgi:O-methyltransferase involved in polyketide biosynthesis
MDTRIKVELGDVQKTLFMPVWARAAESKKDKPVLIDKTAVQITESVDFDFKHMSENTPEISQLSWIARCMRYDMILKDFEKNHPDGTVVNIGCGLDTTYERLNSGSIMWYDLDLPDVIELKKKFLNETEKRKFISCSFLDTKWFNDIEIKDKVLFISAGVFVYFNEPEIKNFLLKVTDKFEGSELFFDVTSPKGVEFANQVIRKSTTDPQSFFKWGLSDKSVITSWDKRIKLIDTYHTFKIDGFNLSSENKIIAIISDSLDVQYMLHLEIKK